ncbi:MAG: adenylate/guanylate cyclase domain-containing protein [Anderseniella sp.]
MSDTRSVVHTAPLPAEYLDAIVATGLADDIVDINALAPHPFRYAEGQFLCRRGEASECLWIVVTGSVAVKEDERTLFVRQRNQVVGEQNLLGNGHSRMYDLVANESNVEVLIIERQSIDNHPDKELIWRNIARVISLKLKNASAKISSLSRQLEDDTRILHAYTNQYALSRRLQSGGDHLSDYQVDKAIVWFSDIADFSKYALQLAPERTADIVQRFFNAQSVPIAAHGGHIDKFIGDGLMAFWVLSNSGADSRQACVDTLRAAEEAKGLVSEIKIGRVPLRLRVGLHIGLVLSGDFGSAARHQFTLIGPEVNKAARLEQAQVTDVVDGSTELGDIRLSNEFFQQLSQPIQRHYNKTSKAVAKNIGEITLHS